MKRMLKRYLSLGLLTLACSLSLAPRLEAAGAKHYEGMIDRALSSFEKTLKEEMNKEDRIDVMEFKEMDIQDVLKLIAKKSGLNIVPGKNVRGKVTVYLKDVSVRDALHIILDTNGFAYVQENGIIKVMTDKEFETLYGYRFGQPTTTETVKLKYVDTPSAISILSQVKSATGKVIADTTSNTLVLVDRPENVQAMLALVEQLDLPVKTEIFDLSYGQAEEVAGKISETLTKDLGKVRFDKRSNQLVVTDTEKKLKEIETMIMAFDQKDREVLIEAKIIQIVLSDKYKRGVDWQAIVQNYHDLSLTSNLDLLGASDKGGKLSIGTLSRDNYTAIIEGLDEIGETNILSSPRIVAVNNQEAKILVGSTEPYVTSTTTTPASGATTTAESVNFIEVGVKLFVTPTIHNDDFITMKIKPEVSSVTRFVTTSSNNTIPVVETSEAETTISAKDGVTIVIGGLIKNEEVETRKKVPILADVPVLGMAFRNRDEQNRKTELAIFLTPHIISGDVFQEDVPVEPEGQAAITPEYFYE